MKESANTNSQHICLNCGATLVGMRSDAKFCSAKCRSAYYNKNSKSKINEVKNDIDGIKSTLEDNPINKTPLKSGAIVSKNKSNTGQANKNYLDALYRNRLIKQQQLNILKQNASVGVIGKMSQVGSILGRHITGNGFGEILGNAAFTLVGINTDTEKLEKELKDKIIYLENEITWLEKTIKHFEKEDSKNTAIPGQLIQSDRGISVTTNSKSEKQPNMDKTSSKNSQSKAISIQQLKEFEYQVLNFKGRWLSFIGNPAAVFFMIIFGKPGARKSTFAILLADYLAKFFGKVLYISSEEGFAKTFKDKVELLGVDAEDLFIADSKNLENIKAELKTNHYNFVFIDSLDTLGIGPQEMKELRQLYPDIAFITISQSTKDGKMRGSNELIHDSDIVVQVEDGVASIIKNRYLKDWTEFKVF